MKLLFLSIWFHPITWMLVLLAITCAGLLFIKRYAHSKDKKERNDFVMMNFGIAGTLTALLLAFVVLAVWQDYEETNATIAKEANCLSNMYSYSNNLDDSLKLPLKVAVRNYVSCVLDDEWRAMESDEESKRTEDAFLSLRRSIFKMRSLIKAGEKELYETEFKYYLSLSDLRRERLAENTSHLPAMVWIVLFVGTFIVILIGVFFQSDNFKLQLLLNGIIAILFALVLYLCYALDHPFYGNSKLSDEPFKALIEKQFIISDSTY
jgi:uncharacterized membrane protein YraQ (UPF0718 family)